MVQLILLREVSIVSQKVINYEEQVSSKQLLSFNYVSDVLESLGMRFTEVQQRVLGIRNADNVYTNLGLWLSDENPITINVSEFASGKLAQVDNTIEFKGSILKQYFDIVNYLQSKNKTHRTFIRGVREEVWEYPKEAIEEIVMNMIIHRDYSIQGSSIIKVLNDRIEFVSFGGLPLGIKFDELFIGMSVCRNKCLANFFKHAHVASGFGLGIGKIRDSYFRSIVYPRFKVNEDVFKVILPNQEYAFDMNNDKDPVHLSLAEMSKLLIVLESLKEQKTTTKKIIQDTMQISTTRCMFILNFLVAKELLEVVETDKGKVYQRPR